MTGTDDERRQHRLDPAAPPDLPGCGQPAAVRMEIWTAQDGIALGSLDGIGYACHRHAADLVRAIHAAGCTPLRTPGSLPVPTGSRTCGDLTWYGDPVPPIITQHIPVVTVPPVAVPLPEDDPAHPDWCDRGPICQEDQRHTSGPHPANPVGARLYLRAWLEQAWEPADAPVQLVLELTGDDGEVTERRMELGQPRALVHTLGILLRLAGAG